LQAYENSLIFRSSHGERDLSKIPKTILRFVFDSPLVLLVENFDEVQVK